MVTQSHTLHFLTNSPPLSFSKPHFFTTLDFKTLNPFSIFQFPKLTYSSMSTNNSKIFNRIDNGNDSSVDRSKFFDRIDDNGIHSSVDCFDTDRFAYVANLLADAAGEVIRCYFRKSFDILDKDDLSPVTIADKKAEEAMISIIFENLPSHAIYGEENGWMCKEDSSDYVWVLDPIDGTKSFITGKPLFGTLIALLYKGKPILGVIDQPILKERWIGRSGKRTTLNGQEVSTRTCANLSKAYLYTTSPHLFSGNAEEAFARVRSKVKVPLYGCDCYAYALLASGFVDLVVESGLKPYDFLSLIPVIEGAGGVITDWEGNKLLWEASPDSQAPSFNVLAAGDKQLHKEALDSLQWK